MKGKKSRKKQSTMNDMLDTKKGITVTKPLPTISAKSSGRRNLLKRISPTRKKERCSRRQPHQKRQIQENYLEHKIQSLSPLHRRFEQPEPNIIYVNVMMEEESPKSTVSVNKEVEEPGFASSANTDASYTPKNELIEPTATSSTTDLQIQVESSYSLSCQEKTEPFFSTLKGIRKEYHPINPFRKLIISEKYLSNTEEVVYSPEIGILKLNGFKRILERPCYFDIFHDILKNIYRSRCKRDDDFIPQCCFLIYGNRSVGKTALCYFLAHKFKRHPSFNDCDIIVAYSIGNNDQSKEQRCYIRYGDNKKRDVFIKSVNDVSPKKRPTIVISDNISINEDDFSADDVIIMISPPKAENYQIFKNTRGPIQYCIPQLEGDELKIVLFLLQGHFNNFDLASEFGGNLLDIEPLGIKNMIKEYENVDMEECDYIPRSYNEQIFIYDISKFDQIPTRLRFLSKEIENYFIMREVNTNEKKCSGFVPKIKGQKTNGRSKRLKLKTSKSYPTSLDESLKQKYRIVKLKKAEEDSYRKTDGITENDIEKIKFESCNTTSINKERNEIDSMKCIFDRKYCGTLPKIVKDDKNIEKSIRINYHVYQYPMNVVYIRESYRALWKLFEKAMKYQKLSRIELNEEEKKEFDKLGEELEYLKEVYKSEYVFLLRGNPGLGKSSFVIYLLCKLQEYAKKGYVIVFWKKVNNIGVEYQLTKDGSLEEITEKNPIKYGKENNIIDVLITDSFNCSVERKIHNCNLVIYIISPDSDNYNHYYEVSNKDKRELYLDVFSDNEIEEWMKLCLPSHLSSFIVKNNLCKIYGNVPRYIYFAGVYGEYFNRDYWSDIYTKSIDTIIRSKGFIEFINNYLINADIILNRMGVFDITLYHKVIKYLIIPSNTEELTNKGVDAEIIEIKKNLIDISKSEMAFISNDVVEYIFKSINHISDINEIEMIVNIYNNKVDENNILLKQLLFKQLVRFECSFYVETLNETLKDKTKGKDKIETIDDDIFENKFKKLFKSAIYSTNMKGVYILTFLSLENGDVIYLVNNCFVHVSITYSNKFKLGTHVVNYLSQCMTKLNGIFTKFYFLSYFPDSNKEANVPGGLRERCYLSDCKEGEFESKLNIKSYFAILEYKNNDKKTIQSNCNVKIKGVDISREKSPEPATNTDTTASEKENIIRKIKLNAIVDVIEKVIANSEMMGGKHDDDKEENQSNKRNYPRNDKLNENEREVKRFKISNKNEVEKKDWRRWFELPFRVFGFESS